MPWGNVAAALRRFGRQLTHTLVGRVSFTAALVALLASGASLALAIGITDHFVLKAAQGDTLKRATALLGELLELREKSELSASVSPPAESSTNAALEHNLAEEIDEFSFDGRHVAVFLHGVRVAGTAALPSWERADGCRRDVAEQGEWLICGVSHARSRSTVVVAVATASVFGYRGPLVQAGLTALLGAVLAALLAGWVVARSAQQPLVTLRDVLQQATLAGTPPQLPRGEVKEVQDVVNVLSQLLQRLDSELTRSRRFAADAAHELRTPLAKLLTDIELLVEEEHDAQPVAARSTTVVRLGHLVSRVQQLSELVERLLMLATPGGGVVGLSLVSMAAVAEAMPEHFAGVFDVTRLRVRCDDDGLVIGDLQLLTAVLSNAVSNALKFSSAAVEVTVSTQHGSVVVDVIDGGPGLDAETRKHAFEPFYRGPQRWTASGSGIGLALIAHVVAEHDGSAAFQDCATGSHLQICLLAHGQNSTDARP